MNSVLHGLSSDNSELGLRSEGELQSTLHHLMSLNDGDRGVLEVVAIGHTIVPYLRHLLFQRESSGLFQPRCRVVEALAALGAHEVLRGFLNTDREITDPVERAGEDAVINAAARALHDNVDETMFRRLLLLAETRALIGPLEVLGAMRRQEALPCLVAALADDLARPVAEEALCKSGAQAAAALIKGAVRAPGHDGQESESSRRRRRCALRLLIEIGQAPGLNTEQRTGWRSDPDPEIAVLGCRLALDLGDAAERRDAVHQLIRMLDTASWMLRREIGTCLVEHPLSSKPIIEALAANEQDHPSDAETHGPLLNIMRHLGWDRVPDQRL